METNDIVGLFCITAPINIEIKNTSHGDDDFRETLIVDLGKEKMVIKLSSNGFTDEKHLIIWERIANEYRNLGYCKESLYILGPGKESGSSAL